jgi:hypothetical protein
MFVCSSISCLVQGRIDVGTREATEEAHRRVSDDGRRRTVSDAKRDVTRERKRPQLSPRSTRVSWRNSRRSWLFPFLFSFVNIRPRIDSYEGASTPRFASSMSSPFPAQPMTPSMPVALGLLRVAKQDVFRAGEPMLGKRVGDPNLDRSEIPNTESGGDKMLSSPTR